MTDNELIARFMGGVKSTSYSIHDYPDELPKFILSDLKYHRSWDWLMPVVEKIGQMDGDYTVSINTEKEPSLYGHECSIYDPGHTVSFLLESKNLIEAVYNTVVEFIKWYNQQQHDSPSS